MEVKVEDVKEILFYLDPLIRSQESAGAEAETLIKSLQELDGGLGQYRLTSSLRLRLREVMMDSIRREVSAATKGRSLTVETMQELAPSLLGNLIKERQWAEFVCEVKHEVGGCSRQVAEGLSLDTPGGSQSNLVANSGPESLGSTWHQANFIMVQPEQLRRLAGQMVSGEIEGRVQALNTLLLSQISDVTGSQHWPEIKAGYRKCLSHPSTELSSLSLKFHARLMVSGSHFAIKEGFINLLETISGWYSDKKLFSELPSTGISRDSHLHQAALNILSLALSMATDLPRIWIRFPQRYVEEIIDSMIECLGLKSSSTQCSPLTLLSVVDHEAGWLRDWLHSKISRTIFMKKLSNCRDLVKSIQQDIINYIESTPVQHYQQVRQEIKELREKSELLSVSGSILQFVSFLHKVSFILKILTYKSGAEVVEEKDRLLSTLTHFILFPGTANHPGRFITEKFRILVGHHEELLVPFTEILSDQQPSAEVVVNALSIVHQQSRHSPISESILSSLNSLWLRFSGDGTSPVRGLIKSIMNESGRFPVTFTFPSWRNLMTRIMDSGEENVLHYQLDQSARIFFQNGFRERYCEDKKLSYALLCRNRNWAELLANDKVFKDKIDHLYGLIHGNEETKMICPSGDVEVEERIQELMLLVSSNEFVVSHSKDKSLLISVLSPKPDESSIEWRVAMLRLVLAMTANLDSLIALEQRFHISNIVETAIKDCQQDDGMVVDEEFLYLRYIYSLLNNIGGPSEMRRCSLSLSEDLQTTEPALRQPTGQEGANAQSKAMDTFLEDGTRVLDLGWIQTAASMFREVIASATQLSVGQTVRLLEKFSIINNNPPVKSPRIEVIDTTDDSLGLNMIIKYGMNADILERRDEAALNTRLAELLKVSRSMFPVSSYDWFVSSVFLLTAGDLRVSSGLLEALSPPDLLLTPLLWHNSAAARQQNFQLLTVGFTTELILDGELPALAAFFNMNNIPISAVLDLWLRQCFINFLDFRDVKNFILFSLLFGADYIVYFCVSVLCHIQEEIMEQEEWNVNILQKIITRPITGFSSVDYLPYMDILSKKHRPVIMQYFTSMMNQ